MEKPYPNPDPVTAPYWKACNEQKLIYQMCSACNTVQPFPRAVCVSCSAHSDSLAWHDSNKKGTLTTFTLVHRGPNKAFKDDQPYLLALVDLNEGFRLMVNLRDCKESDLIIGMPISIVFEKRGPEGQYIPQARI